jgi:hypothetical protein
MTENAETAKLLAAFLADEEAAFARDEQGSFWPSNHHRITPAAAKAETALAPEERVRFYFHFMRVSGEPPAASEKEFSLIVDAYRLLLAHIDDGFPNMAKRHVLLFHFGFDEAGALPSGATKSMKEIKARQKALQQIRKYTMIETQQEKAANFLPFAGEGVRILETLRHLGYRPDRRYGDEVYVHIELVFWGMVLIALTSRAARPELARDFLDGGYVIPKREQHLDILRGSAQAVLPFCGEDETEFRALAARLAALYAARREATEAARLAQTLALPFNAQEDWQIQIAIPQEGSSKSPFLAPNLTLAMRPLPDREWNIWLKDRDDHGFTEHTGIVTRNDGAIPALGRGNLANFPAWLRKLRDEHGLAFEVARAEIKCGTKRAAAKIVARWLSGED